MHPDAMKSYFKGSELAQMSNGTYCIIRPLGLVKGGKGLKHHENLLTLSFNGIALKLGQVPRYVLKLLQGNGAGKAAPAWISRTHER